MSEIHSDSFESMLLPEDFERASEDLLALKRISPENAIKVAHKILENRIGDAHYQAFAFDIFYSLAKERAIDWIVTHSEHSSARVIGAMLTSVTEDSGILNDSQDLQKAIVILRKIVALRGGQFSEINQTIEWFNKTYPSH